jgi:MFS family permease
MGGLSAAVLAVLPRDVPPPHREAEAEEPFLISIAAGAKALLGNRELRSPALVQVGLGLVDGALDVLVVVVALEGLAAGADAVGTLNAAWGAGGLAGGAIVIAGLGRGRFAAALFLGAVTLGLAALGAGLATSTAAAAVAFLLVGAGFSSAESTTITLIQRLAPDDVLARVLGAAEAKRSVAAVAGAALAPVLVNVFGLEGALIATGAIVPAIVLGGIRTLRSLDQHAAADEADVELLRALDLFAPLPLATVETLAARAEHTTFGDGEAVITEGEHGTRFYAVVSGAVVCTVGGRFARRLERGGYVGEIALIRDVPRTATVVADGPLEVISVEREEFLLALGLHRRSTSAAAATVDSRLQDDAARAAEA